MTEIQHAGLVRPLRHRAVSRNRGARYALNMDPYLKQLNVDERIRLVEDLWDSIAADQNVLPLTQEQRLELDRRLDRYDDEAAATQPAAEAIARIRKRL